MAFIIGINPGLSGVIAVLLHDNSKQLFTSTQKIQHYVPLLGGETNLMNLRVNKATAILETD